MQFMALIYSADGAEQNYPGGPEKMMADYYAYTEEVKKAGVMVAGDALQPTSTATSIRERDGKASLTDGPFAETKEQLGGYYLLECKDLDEAIKWAGKIPTAKYGTIEVRPVMIWDQ
ncbi:MULTISPECIES: YciI family protein [Maritalea]|uniref:Glutathione transferase n=1 Tax=Maritalea myrionectae TaxID=454601 RepID=A0A2R4MCP5_9HYPH|nr:YciI family protein [Maritalea myrionectae]AVX03782.1 glutathione transferase [Maritalea myrionectae]